MTPDLETALSSGQLSVLLWTAGALGLLHTILGPDHYVPFVMMAKANRWSRKKTFVVTTACGIGHVVASILIAVVLILGGTALAGWEGSFWAGFNETRGSISAWLLIGAGAALGLWGLLKAVRGRRHAHPHAHESGDVHLHEHDHAKSHMHAHDEEIRRLTPWVLFTIFVFGPCESLIPLMLAGWAAAGLLGSALVAGAFALTTVLTIVLTVVVLLRGISLLPLGKLERYTTAIAGLSLILCGAGIQFLGL